MVNMTSRFLRPLWYGQEFFSIKLSAGYDPTEKIMATSFISSLDKFVIFTEKTLFSEKSPSFSSAKLIINLRNL